jgi:hypothetical protein
MRKKLPLFPFLLLLLILFTGRCTREKENRPGPKDPLHFEHYNKIYQSAKPYTRWWWFAREIRKKNIRHQLDWIESQGFGGVEIAWIYPVERDPNAARTPYLSEAWSGKVAYAKQYADSLGLGCDFTFGTLWPFGGTFVPGKDAARIYGDTSFRQPLRLSWTHPDTGLVIDHMDKQAFNRYADTMARALQPALEGDISGLFCDSWEVETRKIWTDGFARTFINRYGYDIRPFMDSIYSGRYQDERYDYMKLVAERVLNHFYRPFTKRSHELGAFSRVQCAGSPTDIIRAYANVDVPETEAMLYEPNYGKIVSSAALLAEKPLVSAESFTCLYGFPDKHHREEQTADLKLVADALFANGVNQIIWHGMPYNPKGVDSIDFYATVHVGKTGSLSDELRPFNDYMTRVSQYMRKGRPYSDIAVYLPLEDSWIKGEYPPEKQMEWSWGAYELRYQYMADELNGYQPHWINRYFLEQGTLENGTLYCGEASFEALYVDVDHLDSAALATIYRLASEGFPVCLKNTPRQPGRNKSTGYNKQLNRLVRLDNVSPVKEQVIQTQPLVQSSAPIKFRARQSPMGMYIFFPHPRSCNLDLPLDYGFSHSDTTIIRSVVVHHQGKDHPLVLAFEPYQSLLLHINEKGEKQWIDISYQPPEPEKERSP